jgi:hypothetical protein
MTTNVQFVDFESERTWSIGAPLSRHLRRPAPDLRFDWLPLSQPTSLVAPMTTSRGGLGSVSSDERCSETFDLFSSTESLTNDPDGFTYVEQRAELAASVIGFAFPVTLVDAEAAPAAWEVSVALVAELTRDKTKLDGTTQLRQRLSSQPLTLLAACTPAPQVTKRWVARTDRDDPAFCRAVGTGSSEECVQFNVTFSPERCELSAAAATLQLPSGSAVVDLAGSLIRQPAGGYALRVNDVRLPR